MSKRLLQAYIREAVKEAHLARVPNQLVSTGGHEGEEDDGDADGSQSERTASADVNEFAAGGGGNALATGNVMGFSGPLGAPKKK